MSLIKILSSIILVGLFMVGFGFMISDFSNEYNPALSSEMNQTFKNFSQQFDSATEEISDARNKSFDTQADNTVDTGVSLLDSIITTKNLITGSFTITNKMAGKVEETFKIRSEFKQALIAVLVISMVLIFLSAVLKNPL